MIQEIKMSGLGTIINCAAIAAGGATGLLAGNAMKERYQETLNMACGVSILFLGIGGAMEKMLSISDGKLVSSQSLMIVICMALGSLIGEILNIERAFELFGEWLKKKTGNAKDKLFVDGFVTASLTVSIGAMAIVGAIQDGISGDWSILIFCIGLNLVWDKKIRVSNMLPAIVLAVIAAII